MTDVIDLAQQTEEADRAAAIAATQARIAASYAPRAAGVDALCIDCDEPIEPQRLAVLAGKTSRCASCGHDHEQRMRGYR